MENGIKRFESINSYLEAANCDVRSNLEDFFIVQISDLGKDTLPMMSLFQKDFHQMNLITRGDTGAYRIDVRTYPQESGNIYFISPSHIYSWVKHGDLNGYLIYFKKSLFNMERVSLFDEEFQDLFDIENENILSLGPNDFKEIKGQLQKLRNLYNFESPYRYHKIASYMTFFFFRLKELWSKKALPTQKKSHNSNLLRRYLNLIANLHLRERKTMFYAGKLKVTPNHLNAVCKKDTGKTAKSLLEEQVVQTSKLQLVYDQRSISEISFTLGFEEPTNFSRFFKRKTGMTPQQFIDKNR